LEAKELQGVLQSKLNVKHLVAVEVDHCIESYGCLIVSDKEPGRPEGFGRIFYSGDTNVCQNVLNYAQKVTLLIHEATFEDALEVDAMHKKHTTIS
jgi:ribonuclease Z